MKYCQLSYDLDREPRFLEMKTDLGLSGIGAFFELYKEIRKCGGRAPRDYLIRHLRSLRMSRRRALQLLDAYGLFLTDPHGTVTLQLRLSAPLDDDRQLSLFPEEQDPSGSKN